MKGCRIVVALLAFCAAAPHAALAESAAAANPAVLVALDRAFLVGFWTDDNDCGDVIEFVRDGRFVTANGGTGLWNLDDDRLTLTGETTAVVRLVPVDRDTITVVHSDGSLGRSTRCAGRAAAPKADHAPEPGVS